MDVWTALRTTARRWYVSVPILVMTLGIAVGLAINLDPVYSAESSAIPIGPSVVPRSDGAVDKLNPFLSLGGSLNGTTQALTVLMDSEAKRVEMENLGLEVDYTVNRVDSVITFAVTGKDVDSVVSTANSLVEISDAEMVKLQVKAEVSEQPSSRIRIVALAVPKVAAANGRAHLLLLAAVAMLGMIMAIASSIAVDGFLRWRRLGRNSLGRETTNRTRNLSDDVAHPARSTSTPAARTGTQPVGTKPA